MEAFNGSERVGDIVAGFPGAGNLMREYRIDFCCGGNRTLSEALEERRIEKRIFLDRLNELYRQSREKRIQAFDWRDKTASELIDHIVQTQHANLRQELPLLSEFVTKILRVHGDAHPELEALHDRFHRMKEELERHLLAEEEAIFPLIRKAEQTGAPADGAEAATAIGEMEDDHSAVGDLLKEMREITRDYRLPEDACRTYALTFRKLEELESDLFEHIHLENNVLFPKYRQLCETRQQQCGAAMFGGRGPAKLCEPLARLKQEHGPLREQMDAFARLASEIGQDGGIADWSGRLAELKRKIDAFVVELDPHSEREEGTLFPLMAKYIGRETGPIAVMEFEHDLAKANLKQFREAVEGLNGAVDAGRAREIAALAIQAHAVLAEHFMKEENVLFPMAENMLNEVEKAELGRAVGLA